MVMSVMRVVVSAMVIAVLVSACTSAGPGPASDVPASATDPPATTIVTLRPATAAGATVAGWSVREEGTTVECGRPSPASVSDQVQYCGPSAAAAGVCWPRGAGASVICLRDPWERVLYGFAATGVVAVKAVADPDPVGLELDDGTRCRLRNGGAWGGRDDDPQLAGFYGCGTNGFVAAWGPQGGSAFTKTAGSWTVRIGTTTGPLRTARVVTAYLVGTAVDQ